MTRVSSLILLAVASVALASPALAKTTITQGENLCKEEVKKQKAPKTLKLDKDETKATQDAFIYVVKIKDSADVASKVKCTVSFETNAVILGAE
jgi:hypothetical protein